MDIREFTYPTVTPVARPGSSGPQLPAGSLPQPPPAR
jgi:hypothetical protein